MYVREGDRNDIPYCADIGVRAFHDDALMKYIKPYKEQYPNIHRDHYLFQCRKLLQSGASLIVAIDADQDGNPRRERIVGFAVWTDSSRGAKSSHNTLGRAFETFAMYLEGLYRENILVDKAMQKLNRDAFRRSIADNVFFDDIEDYWELEIMAVSPSHERRGVGTLLLQWGMRAASGDNTPIVVVATPAGARLYARHGFIKLGSMDVGHINDAWSAMVWRSPKLQNNS